MCFKQTDFKISKNTNLVTKLQIAKNKENNQTKIKKYRNKVREIYQNELDIFNDLNTKCCIEIKKCLLKSSTGRNLKKKTALNITKSKYFGSKSINRSF